MATAAQVAIDIVTDQSRAVAGLDDVGTAARQMADNVEQASRTADRAVSSLDNVASSADDLGGKAGKATGALGALSSGAELAGPQFAGLGTALQSAALATDFMSGVGDSLNLVLESTIVKNVKARAVTIAKTVAEKAAATASRAMAAAQWLVNAAMAANPIGLVVVAIAALVAGFILAYKKSETFRNIVKAAGEMGKAALGWIVDRVQDVIDIAGKVITWFKDKIPSALDSLGDKARAIGDVLLAPFRVLKDIIDEIIALIKKIDLPDLPDLNPFGGSSSSSGRTVTSAAGGAPVIQVQVDVPGGFIGNEDQLVAKLTTAINRGLRLAGPLGV